VSSRLTLEQIPIKYHGQIAKQLYGSAFYLEREASSTIAKQIVQHESLAEAERKTMYAGKVLVRITSYRRRLLDRDNLCGKWFLDAARYSRIIRNDTPEDINYEISQCKVKKAEDEETQIEFIPIESDFK
jgi:hypothetical protein